MGRNRRGTQPSDSLASDLGESSAPAKAQSASDAQTSAPSPVQPKRRVRGGTVLIIIGAILVAAALALTAYNWWDSNRAGEAAVAIQEQLDPVENAEETGDAGSSTSNDSNTDDGTTTIDGVEYLGTLEVPALNLKLPVARDWDYNRLNMSPCRYSGLYTTHDLVICAHNYTTHFGPIENVDIGADVYFTTVGGKRIHYVVGNRETLEPTAIQQMIENENNSERKDEWDLTLFTCTLDGQARVAVRCLEQ